MREPAATDGKLAHKTTHSWACKERRLRCYYHVPVTALWSMITSLTEVVCRCISPRVTNYQSGQI